jgi:hypothetical protein
MRAANDSDRSQSSGDRYTLVCSCDVAGDRAAAVSFAGTALDRVTVAEIGSTII